jgi:hypothetical protein
MLRLPPGIAAEEIRAEGDMADEHLNCRAIDPPSPETLGDQYVAL